MYKTNGYINFIFTQLFTIKITSANEGKYNDNNIIFYCKTDRV